MSHARMSLLFLYRMWRRVPCSLSVRYEVALLWYDSISHTLLPSCDEVEKKKETDSRLTVEEAISAAKIRNCPKCRKAFVKESGCNKITCASCGTKSCYICKEPIAGYEHFCKKPHCQGKKCGKCHLHTNAEEDDARIMREIGTKVAREEKEASGVDVNVAALL